MTTDAPRSTLRTRIRKMKAKTRKLHHKPRKSKYRTGDLLEVRWPTWGYPEFGVSVILGVGDKLLVIEDEIKDNDHARVFWLTGQMNVTIYKNITGPEGTTDFQVIRLKCGPKKRAISP